MSAAGVWVNEYGSRVTLALSGTAISGIYESTTGSTGRYAVFGWQAGSAPSAVAGQPVSLAIAWHSLDDDPSDPSWNWSSGLGGQITLVGGEPVMVLSHLLVASSDFPGLMQKGVYADKLTYRRVADTEGRVADGRDAAPQGKNRLAGSWRAEDGTRLLLDVIPSHDGRFGRVAGTLVGTAGVSEVTGVTDINALADRLDSQSLALTALAEHAPVAITLAGNLQLLDDELELQLLTNRVTSPDSTYVQTEIRALRLARSA